MAVQHRVIGLDVSVFLVAYALAIGAALLPSHWMKVPIALILLILYPVYVFRHLRAESGGGNSEGLKPLHLSRWALRVQGHLSRRALDEVELDYYSGESSAPTLRISVLQVSIALAVMIAGAALFVRYVQEVAVGLGTPALILSLLIAPFATELPEKFNSILWVRSGKDTLAIGNITGAMVFQACIPVSLGILFTNWAVAAENTSAFLSAGIAIASAAVIFGAMLVRGRLTAHLLLIGGLWYGAYVVSVFTLFNQ